MLSHVILVFLLACLLGFSAVTLYMLTSSAAHMWPAQLWVNELVALDERDAQLSGNYTAP
jgi:hypothetical protein